jgi:hypothetical protein
MSPNRAEVEQLLREVERYLATVEIFRAEGREPVWLDDVASCEELAL